MSGIYNHYLATARQRLDEKHYPQPLKFTGGRASEEALALARKIGLRAAIKAVAALSYWMNYDYDPMSSKLLARDAVVLSPLMPAPTGKLYRGITVSKNHPLAKRPLRNTFWLRGVREVSAWTGKESFAKTWTLGRGPCHITFLLKSKPKIVVSAPGPRIAAINPALLSMMGGNAGFENEEEWIFGDRRLSVQIIQRKWLPGVGE